MNEIINARLIEIAKRKSFITYQQLSNQCHLNLDMADIVQRQQLAHLLEEITTNEFNSGRPLLSVVVFSQNDNRPGNGFFEISGRLGVYTGGNNTNQQDIYFINELNKCYDYWANH